MYTYIYSHLPSVAPSFSFPKRRATLRPKNGWPVSRHCGSGEGVVIVGRSGPNLKPGTVCVCGMNGLRKGIDTT